ncbi:toll/interleukin-1 receptor domain-containing protein [Sphingobacteriaceae bacterium WQ 2009]|uniref:Toll/interleukin-1 receptor domain-containing protein n=1 Tax=Rhinopithecimicrobium faecis TaxID=2820698 RepID=A0A8T4HBS3_9SPHI|nr:toll/interleukin-1 receptor domain-containing protein [Sphingobacteriaceae bacterium WQ 2009]
MYKQGFNKANIYENILWAFEKDPTVKTRPCVFLSHKREDKDACKVISSYLKNAGIDYYLDIEDNSLQSASNSNDPIRITESIKEGIKNSTHMLVVISEKTYKSLWVPFEVGYGHASILEQDKLNAESNKLKLSVLTLRDISEVNLPDYLQVAYIIKGTKSLNTYINKINDRIEKSSLNEVRMMSHTEASHPLDNVLNWQL